MWGKRYKLKEENCFLYLLPGLIKTDFKIKQMRDFNLRISVYYTLPEMESQYNYRIWSGNATGRITP